MYRIIITISIAFIFMSSAFSQDTIDFVTANSKTLEYTNASKWDSVIYIGNMALKSNIDYFYLRVRLGTAYYNKQNYAKATREFKKAIRFNSSDTYTQEMLYYSYVSAGRDNDALFFTSTMSDDTKKVAGIKKPAFLNSLYFEGGPIISNNFSKNKNIDFNDTVNRGGNACLLGNVYYGHLGAKFQAGKKISFYAGFSKLSQQLSFFNDASVHKPAGRYYNQWDTVTWKPMPMPGQYTYDTIIENRQAFKDSMISGRLSNNLQQNEFYFNCILHLSNGMDLTPFLHLLNTKYTYQYPILHKQVFTSHDTIATYTQFYFPMPPGSMTDTVFYNYITHDDTITKISFLDRDTSYTNFSAGAELSKNFGHVTASVFGSFSNLNGLRQKEGGFTVTYYPFGNMNLYLNGVFTALSERKNKMKSYGFLAGTKITNSIWLEGSVTLGKMINFSEKSGFIVNNNTDATRYRIGLMPVFIFKNFTLTVLYQFQEMEGAYSFNNETNNITTKTFAYQNQMITGGIKWKF